MDLDLDLDSAIAGLDTSLIKGHIGDDFYGSVD